MPESGLSSAPPADRVYSALASRFRKDQVLNSEAARREHAHGESYHPDALPDAVFYAESTDEVASAVTLCHAHGVPVIAFGAGTSLEGHVAATNGGLCIDSREAQLAEDVNASIVMQALSAGGTCTGEHGIGYGKVRFLEIERAPAEIELMRSLKRALDPSGILNPGKILRP